MAASGSPSCTTWDEADYLGEIMSKFGDQVSKAVERIIVWSREKGLEILFSGKQDKSCSPVLQHDGCAIKLIVVWTSGTIYLPFNFGRNAPFFQDIAKREELIVRFKSIPVAFDTSKPSPGTKQSNPKIHLGSLRSEERVEKFIQVLEWELSELKAK